MTQVNVASAKPDYGLDAPGLVKAFLAGGVLMATFGALIPQLGLQPEVTDWLSNWLLWPGLSIAASGLLMVWSAYVGKYQARDALLGRLSLVGTESVLDLGCGRGLLLLGAAKRLPRGEAIGIDLWSQRDLSANNKEATLANAEAEGVLGRVKIIDGDMRKIPLPDASVDVVVASMSIHNIPTQEGRSEALHEASRVLRPGGRMALLDFKFTSEYAKVLRDVGLVKVAVSSMSFWNFPPSRTVFAEKKRL